MTSTARDRAVEGNPLTAGQYQAIRDFLERRAGIQLGDGKHYLVVSRLTRVLRNYGLSGFEELVRKLHTPAERACRVAVVDAMTTNETFWFRDPAHYRVLTEHILPELGGSRPRIWSAACSSGQEPYSLVMSIQDAARSPAPSCEIVGTDISTRVLAEARVGLYCGLAASRGLTEAQRRRYFAEQGDCIQVRDDYRRGVVFRELNLTRSFAALGRFDVVFCRNVLIYFSAERKRDIIERIAQALHPGGYLFVGSAESMSPHADLFEMRSAFGGLYYRKR